MISTTGDLVTFVLRAVGIHGVGQTPLAENANVCLDTLRMLIAQWSRKRWLTWHEQDVSCVSTGNTYYSIGGVGADYPVGRPDKIHAAFARMEPFGGPNPVDLPLAIVEAPEDWSRITIKDLKSLPAAVFYDSAFPVGRVHFWPVPSAGQYEMHLALKGALPVYTSLTDPLALPDEYTEALLWSLCVRMSMLYGLPARPDHAAAMRQAINTVEMANSQIRMLSMPAALMGRGGDVSTWVGRGLNHAWTLGGGCVLG